MVINLNWHYWKIPSNNDNGLSDSGQSLSLLDTHHSAYYEEIQ